MWKQIKHIVGELLQRRRDIYEGSKRLKGVEIINKIKIIIIYIFKNS